MYKFNIFYCFSFIFDSYHCKLSDSHKEYLYVSGDKKYKVPSLSPLVIPLISVVQGSNLKVELSNVEVRGFENVKLNNIE